MIEADFVLTIMALIREKKNIKSADRQTESNGNKLIFKGKKIIGKTSSLLCKRIQ